MLASSRRPTWLVGERRRRWAAAGEEGVARAGERVGERAGEVREKLLAVVGGVEGVGGPVAEERLGLAEEGGEGWSGWIWGWGTCG